MEELKNIATNESDQRTVDGVPVQINYVSAVGEPVTDAEIRAYISRGNEQHHGSSVTGLNLQVEGDEVGIRYDLTPLPFERIRRITGYLVGTLDRFNDGKRAEEADRVKHNVCCG